MGALRGSSDRRSRLLFAGLWSLGLIALVVLVGLRTAPPTAAQADSCPNAEFRTGLSAYLSDCRAYERVSPPGARPYLTTSSPPSVSFVQASVAGDGIRWFTFYPLSDAPGQGFDYLSTRGSDGWSSESVTPPQSQSSSAFLACRPAIYFSPDLSRSVLSDGFNAGGDRSCGSAIPPLDPDAPEESRNLYLRDSDTGSHELVRVTASGTPPTDAEVGNPAGNAAFQAASSDYSRVVFSDTARLTPDAPDGLGLYLWNEDDDVVRLVSVLPDGTPVSGTVANPAQHVGPGAVDVGPGSFQGAAPFTHAVSNDGSRVLFQANGNLYIRENADRAQSAIDAGVCTDPTAACTVQVDEPQGGSGPGGGGTFKWASADGSHAYFIASASAGLTPDTTPGSGDNLYRYDADTGQLTNVTAGGDARVDGVNGVSEDGAYAYFVAQGALAPGATSGQPNLYVSHDGTTTFVATLDPSDSPSWNLTFLRSRVSPSGRFFAFNSEESLTGYDNAGTTQIYLYDATTGVVSCASCDPTGAPPVGSSRLASPMQMFDSPAPSHLQRNLSDQGRLFFDSPNPLVPRAGNGKMNVFQFELAGVGSCDQPGGCTDLISSGTSSHGSFFYDASANGDDVFFLTSQDLLGDGSAGPLTLYDARVGGGFAEADAPEPCSGDACKGDPAGSPAHDDPGSDGVFRGNVDPARANCNRFDKIAKQAAKKSRKLSRKAKKASSERRSKQLRAQARKQKQKSKRYAQRAKRCRGGSR